MRRTAWSIVVLVGGLAGVVLAALIAAGAVPAALTVVAVVAIPLVVLLSAFIGLMTSNAFIMAPVTAVVAIAAPIVDMTARSYQAGNFDDATLVGLGTGFALAITGAVSFLAELSKNRRPSTAASPVLLAK
jgi:hypothetical protein